MAEELKTFVEERTGETLYHPSDEVREEVVVDTPGARLAQELEVLAKENARLVKQLEEASRQAAHNSRRDATLTHELQLLSEQLKHQETRESDVLSVLAERLPNVITSVRSSRKESLVHILLTAIEHHQEPRVRASLLFHYVTLFKRPDEDERQQLVEGIRQLSQRLAKSPDPSRIESELLSAVRGLTEYRYPEQRVFSVQATQAVCPFLPRAVQRDLIVGLARVWLADSASTVREAAILAVADIELPSLISGQLLVTALGDSSMRVQRTSLQRVLPAIVKQSMNENVFVTSLLSPLIDSLRLPIEVSQARVAAIDYCVSALKDFILTSVPESLGVASDGLGVLFSKSVARKLRGLWPVGEWVVTEFILKMLQIIATTASPQQDCAVMVLSSSVLTLSPVLDELVVSPLFTELVLNGVAVLDTRQMDDIKEKANWALFRPFVRYALTLDPSKETSTISELLGEGVRRCEGDAVQMQEFAKVVCEVAEEYDEVQVRAVDVLWDCVVSESVGLRRAAAECFSVLLHGRCLNAQLVEKRVLPALISISTDSSDDVRVAAVACTAFLATQLTAPDVLQKLGASLVASFRFDLHSCQPWLQSLVNHVGKMPPAFVAAHIYPFLGSAIGSVTEVLNGDAKKKEDAKDVPELQGIVRLLCDCVKIITHLPQHEIPESFSAACVVLALRALSKALPADGLHSVQRAGILQLAKDLENVDSDRENKKERFLSKFRDLLPTADTAEKVDPKARTAAQARTSPKEKDRSQKPPEVRNVEESASSTVEVGGSGAAHSTAPPRETVSVHVPSERLQGSGNIPVLVGNTAPTNPTPATGGHKKSLLSKMQQKLFGVQEGL